MWLPLAPTASCSRLFAEYTRLHTYWSTHAHKELAPSPPRLAQTEPHQLSLAPKPPTSQLYRVPARKICAALVRGFAHRLCARAGTRAQAGSPLRGGGVRADSIIAFFRKRRFRARRWGPHYTMELRKAHPEVYPCQIEVSPRQSKSLNVWGQSPWGLVASPWGRSWQKLIQVRPPRSLALHLVLRRVAASPAPLHCSGRTRSAFLPSQGTTAGHVSPSSAPRQCAR